MPNEVHQSCGKTDEPIEMPFRVWTVIETKKNTLYKVTAQILTGKWVIIFGGKHFPAHDEVQRI